MEEYQCKPMETEEAGYTLLRMDENGSMLLNLEDSTGTDSEESKSAPMLVNVEDSMDLEEDESTSIDIEEMENESTPMDIEETENESTPMDIEEAAESGWRDRDDGFEREQAFYLFIIIIII